MRFNNDIKILLPIIISDFLAGLNPFCGVDINTIFRDPNLCIRLTRMVDVARGVLAGASENRLPILQIKKIAAAHLIGNFTWDELSPIFDNKTAGGNLFSGKESESGRALANTKRKEGRARGGGEHIGRV